MLTNVKKRRTVRNWTLLNDTFRRAVKMRSHQILFIVSFCIPCFDQAKKVVKAEADYSCLYSSRLSFNITGGPLYLCIQTTINTEPQIAL